VYGLVIPRGFNHVKFPVEAGVLATTVPMLQHPEYHSSILMLLEATNDPYATQDIVRVLVEVKENIEPGLGDVTCSAPPRTVIRPELITEIVLSKLEVKRR